MEANGIGQGDPLSLLPALILTSVLFRCLDARWPHLEKGAVIDDRNFRGSLTDVLESYEFIRKFDHASGHLLQEDKSVFAATHAADEAALKAALSGPGVKPPRIVKTTVLVGDVISTALRRSTEEPDKRVAAAVRIVTRFCR